MEANCKNGETARNSDRLKGEESFMSGGWIENSGRGKQGKAVSGDGTLKGT